MKDSYSHAALPFLNKVKAKEIKKRTHKRCGGSKNNILQRRISKNDQLKSSWNQTKIEFKAEIKHEKSLTLKKNKKIGHSHEKSINLSFYK